MKNICLFLCMITFAVTTGCVQKEEKVEKAFLVKVNNEIITQEDFLDKLNSLPEWAKERFKSMDGTRQFLDEIIKEELLFQEAVRSGMDREKEFLDKVEEFRRMTLVSTLLKRQVEEQTIIDEKEVRDYYEEHSDTFVLGEQVRAQHILVDTEKEAEDILQRLLKHEDFGELAKNSSKDQGTAAKGGDLGFFGKGRMVPEFEDVAFRLRPGEVSDPVKTKFGYHIIKVTEKKEGKHREFEEVKTIVERRLRADKQKNLFDAFIRSLREKASPLAINEEELKNLAYRESSAGDSGNISPPKSAGPANTALAE